MKDCLAEDEKNDKTCLIKNMRSDCRMLRPEETLRIILLGSCSIEVLKHALTILTKEG